MRGEALQVFDVSAVIGGGKDQRCSKPAFRLRSLPREGKFDFKSRPPGSLLVTKAADRNATGWCSVKTELIPFAGAKNLCYQAGYHLPRRAHQPTEPAERVP